MSLLLLLSSVATPPGTGVGRWAKKGYVYRGYTKAGWALAGPAEESTVADPVYTQRIRLIGTSLERNRIIGTSKEVTRIVGAQQ